MVLWVILGIVVLLVIAVVASYNKLVVLKNRVKNAWSQIDVQLQRRFDLIPNLVETVKGYAKHEESTFSKIAELRSAYAKASGVGEKAELDNQLTGTLKTLFAVAESYPELKANSNFMELQEALKDTENKLSYARQFYNDITTKYNVATETFPQNIVAGMFNFKQEELFKVDNDEARKNVKVDFN